MKVLSFDIDGVLNLHEKLPSGVCGISPHLRNNFNRIMDEVSDLRLVIHSAWRYLICYECPTKGRSDMTLEGMGYLLQTHGLKVYEQGVGHKLIGHTSKDVYTDGIVDRPLRIREFVEASPEPITRLAIIDDLQIDWGGPEFFHCPNGLTNEIVDQIIVHLNQ